MKRIITLTLIALALPSVTHAKDGEDDSLSFLLLGDWGKGGTSASVYSQASSSVVDKANDQSIGQRSLDRIGISGKDGEQLYQMDVARAMGKYSAALTPKPSFVVALGDNFYTEGVQSSTDSLWTSLWKDVYLGFEALNIPWYPVFGNHDYGYGSKGVQAQINRYREHTDDDEWMFEATNYTKVFDIADTGGTVHIIFIDTTTLAPSVNKCCNEKGGVSTSEQKRRIIDQLLHIDRMLQEAVDAKPTWLMVVGHYPIYSTGDEGDVSELKTYLLPLLDKYNVQFYACGHDHVGEHLVHSAYNTQFYVVGAGTMTTSYAKSTSEAKSLYFGAGYASFAVMTATTQTMTIQWIDTSGTVRYEHTSTTPLNAVPTLRPTLSPSVVLSKRPTAAPSSRPTQSPILVTYIQGHHNSSDARNSGTLDAFIHSNRGKYAIASGGLLLLVCAMLLYSALGRSKNNKQSKHVAIPIEETTTAASGPKHPKLQALRAKQRELKQYMELLEQGEVEKFNEADQSDEELGGHKTTMRTTTVDSNPDTDYSPSSHQHVHSIIHNKGRDEDERSQSSFHMRSRANTVAT